MHSLLRLHAASPSLLLSVSDRRSTHVAEQTDAVHRPARCLAPSQVAVSAAHDDRETGAPRARRVSLWGAVAARTVATPSAPRPARGSAESLGMTTKREQVGWSGEQLDAILDRQEQRPQPARVGYDPADLAKLLGR